MRRMIFMAMDANEGNITSSFGGIDIAVGRMLVNDAKQANEMINKVLNITTQNPLVAGEIISLFQMMIQMCYPMPILKQTK
jgi:hypothetical protein